MSVVAPRVGPVVNVVDDFNRPDENPLAGGWLKAGNYQPLVVAGQRAMAPFAGAGLGSYWTTPLLADDQVAVTLAVLPTPASFSSNAMTVAMYPQSAVLPGQLPEGFEWALFLNSDGTKRVAMYRRVSGSGVSLGVADVPTAGPGDRIALERVGTTLRGWWQPAGGAWTLMVTATDANYPGPLCAALVLTDNDGNRACFDDFATASGAAAGGGGGVAAGVPAWLLSEDFMANSYNVCAPITPSDTVDFPRLTDAVLVGAGGDVNGVMQNGQAVLLKGLPAGAWVPVRFKRINAAATTATGLVALFVT